MEPTVEYNTCTRVAATSAVIHLATAYCFLRFRLATGGKGGAGGGANALQYVLKYLCSKQVDDHLDYLSRIERKISNDFHSLSLSSYPLAPALCPKLNWPNDLKWAVVHPGRVTFVGHLPLKD